MSFKPRTFDEIFAEMRERSQPALTDFEVGSVARTMYESFAYEMALLYAKMHQVYLAAYVDTAEGQQLDQVVAVLGITRGQPDVATGMVTFQRDLGNADIQIPIGTLVATEETDAAPRKVYRTTTEVALPRATATVDARIEALERGETQATPAGTISVMPRPVPGVKAVTNPEAVRFTGKRRETDDELRQRAKNTLIASGKATIISIEDALLRLPDVKDVRVREYFDQERFGSVDVFVDGVDPTDSVTHQRLKDAIDQVRAAGVLVNIRPTQPVVMHGIFQIELDPELQLTPQDRTRIEDEVRDTISHYIAGRKMGQPFVMSQVMRAVLNVSGVENLATSVISVRRPPPEGTGTPEQFDSRTASINRITVAETERLKVPERGIYVASQFQPVPIHIAFQLATLTPERLNAVKTALGDYFKSLDRGTTISLDDIRKHIQRAAKVRKIDQLRLKPERWYDLEPYTDGDIDLSFIEQPTAGRIFGYRTRLNIIGAIQITLPPAMSASEQQERRQHIRQRLEAHIDGLPPDTDIVFADILQLAMEEPGTRATLDPAGDFRVILDEQERPEPGRISDERIRVQSLEKPSLAHLCITSGEEAVQLDVEQLLLDTTVTVAVTDPPPADFDEAAIVAQTRAAIRSHVQQALHHALANVSAGQDIAYSTLQNAIEQQLTPDPVQPYVSNMTHAVRQMAVRATAQCDGRVQVTPLIIAGNLEAQRTVHIRSVERARLRPVPADIIQVEVRVERITLPGSADNRPG